jgi:MFS transporter, FSR family, fosmidomycin resistance protein
VSERGEVDRRALGVLSLGHLASDLCQGAVPALLPFLIARRGYSYADAAALVLAAGIGSALIQPAFGLWADRGRKPWLTPAGLALGGAGIGLAGVAPAYELTFAAVALSGVGVAAFHPEAARMANLASGERRASGMSRFSVGGNAGFALGPLLTTPLVLVLGLEGTLALAALPLGAALVVAAELPRLAALRPEPPPPQAGAAGTDAWGPFARLGILVTLRSAVYFGLQAFVPVWFARELDASEAAGNAALTVMLAAGAAGTLAGGRLADRVGRRPVLIGSTAVLPPLLAAFLAAGPVGATLLLAAVGFVTIASFSLTVVMGQEYLPDRLGLASGVTLGLAIGAGGLAAAALGVLADAAGLQAVMTVVALLPVPMLALALTLPRDRAPARPARARTSGAPPRSGPRGGRGAPAGRGGGAPSPG